MPNTAAERTRASMRNHACRAHGCVTQSVHGRSVCCGLPAPRPVPPPPSRLLTPCPPLRNAERGHERRAPVVGALLIYLKRRPPLSPRERGSGGEDECVKSGGVRGLRPREERGVSE